jgi:hypothetical protein
VHVFGLQDTPTKENVFCYVVLAGKMKKLGTSLIPSLDE